MSAGGHGGKARVRVRRPKWLVDARLGPIAAPKLSGAPAGQQQHRRARARLPPSKRRCAAGGRKTQSWYAIIGASGRGIGRGGTNRVIGARMSSCHHHLS